VHLRLFFSAKTLPRLLLPYVRSRGAAYGYEPALGLRDPDAPDSGRKKVVVEFSSPNTGSVFSDHHLRSTLIGAFISNFYEAMGWDVVRLNYLGDWGKHMGLLGAAWERYGSDEALEARPAEHLREISARIEADLQPEQEARGQAKKDGQNTAEIESRGVFAERDAFFHRMEAGDEQALALWRKFRDGDVADLEAAYQRLGVRFDEYAGESRVKPETIAAVEAELKAKGVLEESEGSWIIDFPKHGGKKGLGTGVVRQRTGSTTYLLRDIAAALDREQAFGFDKMLYVAAAKQDVHFERVFTALRLMGRADLCEGERLEHVGVGKITGLADHLKDAHLLASILDQMGGLVRAEMAAESEVGDSAAAAADSDRWALSVLLAMDMSGKRMHPAIFDAKRMMSFDAHSGLRLQVWFASLTATIESLRAVEGIADAEPDYTAALETEDATDLLRLMAQYPDVTAAAFRTLEPHNILTYLFRLVDAVAVCITPPDDEDAAAGENGESSAAGAGPTIEARKARLELYECARQVLLNGMKVLGFPLVSS